MITAAHAIMCTTDADADGAFFRDVLGVPSVDAGGGWLIFGLSPAEPAAHPHAGGGTHELYLMCDDVHATIVELRTKGVALTRPIGGRRAQRSATIDQRRRMRWPGSRAGQQERRPR